MRIRHLKELISVRSLTQSRFGCRGQVATLMMLLIGGAIIATLAVARMGQMASQANNFSNAADSAALLLASRLGTKSHQLWDSLKGAPDDGIGTTKVCKMGGLLLILIIIIVVIIAIVLVVVFAPLAAALAAVLSVVMTVGAPVLGAAAASVIVAAATIAGTIAGAVAGGIMGGAQGALMGALQGFSIGLAIGGAVTAVASIATTPALINAGAAGLSSTGELGGIAGGAMTVAPTIISPTAYALGAAALTSLTVGATIYNGYIADQITADAMRALAKAMNGMPERKSIRESVFYEALTKTVDDPNVTADPKAEQDDPARHARCYWFDPEGEEIPGDPYDSDGDGITDESIPCFQYFWDRRIQAIKDHMLGKVNLVGKVGKFMKNLDTFTKYVKAIYSRKKKSGGGWTYGMLYRKDVEGAGKPSAKDGVLIEIVRKVEAAGYNVPFWQPGPTKAQIDKWEKNTSCDDKEGLTCATNPVPPGWDDVDALIAEMQAFVDAYTALRNETNDTLATSVETWLPWYYDPESTDDYYDSLLQGTSSEGKEIGWVARLRTWQNQLWQLRSQFNSPCKMAGGKITNAPCRGLPGKPNFTSVDGDTKNEYNKLIKRINNLENKVKAIRVDMQNFYNAIYGPGGINEEVGTKWGGGGRHVIYQWHDIRGGGFTKNNIGVTISKFKIPRVGVKKTFTKTCTVLKDYKDDNGANTWVRVTHGVPNVEVWLNESDDEGALNTDQLWQFPSREKNNANVFSEVVQKQSHAGFSYNWVRLRKVVNKTSAK